MSSIVVLDARPLSQICHPRKWEYISNWYKQIVASGRRVVIAEITDYETRRGLLKEKATRQIDTDDGGKYRWKLVTDGGETIARSVGFGHLNDRDLAWMHRRRLPVAPASATKRTTNATARYVRYRPKRPAPRCAA